MQQVLSQLRRFAIPDLTLVLTLGSFLCTMVTAVYPDLAQALPLIPERVAQGEYWRLATFIFYPLATHPVFAFFVYYFFYVMGTALETEWGEAKFTRYTLIACLASGVSAWWNPAMPVVNGYIYGAIFLAFAQVFPDFMVYVFFVLPLKVKYLALVQWAGYLLLFIASGWPGRAALLLANIGYFLFFGKDIVRSLSGKRREMARPVAAPVVRNSEHPFHLCATCRLTEKTDPQMDFRVCDACSGGLEYCTGHMETHAHVAAAEH